MAAALFILLIQAMRHLRQWILKGRPVGIFLTRLIFVLLIARALQLGVQSFRGRPAEWSDARARIVKALQHTPGTHLVIVRYSSDHYVHHEWVYNGAEIDGSKIVWAREIPGVDLKPLLEYFRGRQVWLVEADDSPDSFEPYHGDAP
jgi:hypothetical protein